MLGPSNAPTALGETAMDDQELRDLQALFAAEKEKTKRVAAICAAVVFVAWISALMIGVIYG